MQIDNYITEDDFVFHQFQFLSQESLVPYIATFNCEEGKQALATSLMKAPTNAVKWRFQTTSGDIGVTSHIGREEYTTIEFYGLRN